MRESGMQQLSRWATPRSGENRRPTRIYALRHVLAAIAMAPIAARASIFEGETLDAVANGIAWVVLFVVPVIVIVVFWMVHVLPEKIAHKRHHPQRTAIQTLCLLSLVFGGLLWPIAWLWAYTKPIGYKLAYGTEKHEDYFHEAAEKLRAGEMSETEARLLRDELAAMESRGPLTPEQLALRDEIDRSSAAAPSTVAVVHPRSA